MFGGMENSVADLVRGLTACGIECTTLSPPGAFAELATRSGAQARTALDGSWLESRWSRSGAKSLIHAARDAIRHADFVHVSSPHTAFLAGLAGVHRRGRLVFHLRGSGGMRRRGVAAIRAAVKSADHLVVPSVAVKQFALTNRIGAGSSFRRAQSTVVVPNPVAAIEPLSELPLVRLPMSKSRILVIGRANHIKGLDVAVKAISYLARPEDTLTIVASGKDSENDRVRQGLADLAHSLGVSGRIHFAAPTQDVVALFRAADVVWIPSRSEAFGRVLIEAFAGGVPVVASGVEGLAENGAGRAVLVPPDSPASLATATEEVLRGESPISYVRLAENRAFSQSYAPKRVAEQLIDDVYLVGDS